MHDRMTPRWPAGARLPCAGAEPRALIGALWRTTSRANAMGSFPTHQDEGHAVRTLMRFIFTAAVAAVVATPGPGWG